MNYLLDTNIVSEFTKTRPHPAVINWLRDHDGDANYLSVITIGEIQQGISRLPSSKKKSNLIGWFQEELLVEYADWIIPITSTIMINWGNLTGKLIREGRKMPVLDSLIASTCLSHDLILVTGNASDFINSGLTAINPWHVE